MVWKIHKVYDCLWLPLEQLDYTLFLKRYQSKIIALIIFVDDMVIKKE